MTNKELASIIEDNNLIVLEDESGAVRQARDINNKINSLEDSLGDLQTELKGVNNSVEEGLNRLNDSDLDLTSKVSETYKRLGQIDQTYKTLSGIADDIDNEVKKLTHEISDVAEQSALELINLEITSAQQYSQLNHQHAHLASRVQDLVKNVQDTHEQLSDSISNNTNALLELEKRLIKEIDTLTTATQQRDDKLEIKLIAAEDSIDAQKAHMLKMQAIDAALDKRAGELEKTTAELGTKGKALQDSLTQLETYTNGLAESLEKLQQQSKTQAAQIVELQVDTSVMSRNVTELATTEKWHFRTISGALLVLLLVIGALGYYQYGLNGGDAVQIAQAQTDIESINAKLQQVDEQVDSLDGRMNYVSPFSQFGKDSVIKGPQWLAKQPAENFALVVSTAASKKELYTIAQRYRHNFTQDLAYYTTKTWQGERHVLVYGSFANNQQASSMLWRMPRYINQQRLTIARIGDIQKKLTTGR